MQETEHPPLDSSIAKVLLDNLKLLNETAFAQDLQLTHEIVNLPNFSGKPTGVILIPEQSNCIACGTTLLLRSDRPSHLALYTEALGTITAFHYHKYCPNRKGDCKLVQFYGFTSSGRHKGFRYDEKWNTLQYLVSSQETAFEISMLAKYDAEILIGQVSYKQKADIYNYHNGYDNTQKLSSHNTSKQAR